MLFKNVASQKIHVYAYDSTTGAAKTGDAGNITGYVSLDGTANAIDGTNPAEVDSTNMPGLYVFDLTQAETNCDAFALVAKSATANIRIEPIIGFTTGAAVTQTGDAFARLGAPAGASVSADVAAVKSDSAAILEDTGTTLDTLIKDIPTVAEFEARTIAAADYLIASDTLARVTLVDTCTTNTDMRGTNSASTHSAADVKTALEADGSKLDHLWEMTEDDGGVRRLTTNALEQAPSGSGLDAAGVRAAIGLASANLDTQLGDIPTVAEFEARTIAAADYLVASDTLARVTLVDTCTTNTDMRGTDSASTHSAADVKTALEADGSKLDHLWEMTEDDGGVRRLTTNALEQAPSGSGLDAAGVRAAIGLASANLDTQLGDIPTVAEFEARTIAAADYLIASDTLARVTLVDTCTTNTDMRGTDSASTHSAADVKTALEADGSKLDHLWEMTEDDGGVRRLTTNALEQAPSGSGLDAAGVRAAIGLASANLDTQLGDIPTVAEFEARTIAAADYLIASDTLARVTLVDTCTTNTDMRGTDSASTHSAADVKTALEADGSKLDHLWEMTEDDGGVRRLTTNALEQAPSGSGLDAAGVRAAIGLASANLDTQLAALPTAAENADAVLDEMLSEHTDVGSVGAGIAAAGSSGDPWATALPGAYAEGTAGYLIGNIDQAGTGAISFSYRVTEELTGAPVSGVTVRVTSDIGGATTVASGTTDVDGTVIFALDLGTYYFWRTKTGWAFTNPDVEAVVA